MEEQDLLNPPLTGYSLGSSYCCQNIQKGGVCIFVTEDKSFNKIDILLHCAEQTLEVCAIELETESSNFRIVALYRAPSANFNQFIERIDATLKYLHNPKSELICGDIKVDNLNDNIQKKQLNPLLTTYNLSHTVQLATRNQNDS
jgi:hypothetical protein